LGLDYFEGDSGDLGDPVDLGDRTQGGRLSERDVHSQLNSILLSETPNTQSRIERLRFQPRHKSRLLIPLCRMVCLPVVRPFLKNDVMKLASHFIKNGYMEGNGVFYVASEDNDGKTKDVTPEIKSSWSHHWVRVNDEFESMLATDPILNVFCGKMFHVWDGNHRVQAWMPIINQDHSNDLGWHYSVDSIILEVKGDVPTMLTALHEVNWYDFYY
jgi:hypothetical protein